MISSLLQSSRALKDEDIDCAYVVLLKGKSDVSKLSEAELADKIKGFDVQNISILFP